jgi:hypothetical protein
MYCPKCGSQTVENQRFCKTCGTNLQMIYDALGGSDTGKGPLGIDFDALTRSAMNFADSWKAGWSDMTAGSEARRATNPALIKPTEVQLKKLPKPKEWLSYSWQHNLRDGLISLLSGAGLAAILYYVGKTAINDGVVTSIQESLRTPINGLERMVGLIWLFALIPVLKGIAQIIYAAFFADSIHKLTERFVPPPQEREPAPPDYARLNETPPSVTEGTTKIFEEAQKDRI